MNFLLSGNTVKFSRDEMRRLNALKELTNAKSFAAVVGAALDQYEAEILDEPLETKSAPNFSES